MRVTVKGFNESLAAIEALPTAVMLGVEPALQQVADHITEWAKADHPWQNRSYDTEERTNAIVGDVTPTEAYVLLQSLFTGRAVPFDGHSGGAGRWIEKYEKMARFKWLRVTVESHFTEIQQIIQDEGLSVGEIVGLI